MRHSLRCIIRRCWPAFLLLAAGCGDSIEAVYRDYCNVQHEVLDDLTHVVDDESAKRFNTAFEARIMPKEEAVDAREEKILNNLFSAADKQITALSIIEMESKSLKGQLDALETRYAMTLNRLRRLIVKIAEDKADELKRGNQSFTIKTNELCPNLSKLRKGKHFTRGAAPGGGLGGGMAPMAGMPGAGPMPGGGPGGIAMPGAEKGKEQPLEPKKMAFPDSNLNRDFEFILECRRTDDPQQPWAETRLWRGAPPELTVKGINLLPKYSVQ